MVIIYYRNDNGPITHGCDVCDSKLFIVPLIIKDMARRGYGEKIVKRTVFDKEACAIEDEINDRMRAGKSCGNLRIGSDFPYRIEYLVNFWRDARRIIDNLEAENKDLGAKNASLSARIKNSQRALVEKDDKFQEFSKDV